MWDGHPLALTAWLEADQAEVTVLHRAEEDGALRPTGYRFFETEYGARIEALAKAGFRAGEIARLLNWRPGTVRGLLERRGCAPTHFNVRKQYGKRILKTGPPPGSPAS